LIDLALYQPEIPQNTGTILRMGACLGVPIHLIEPASFTLSDKALRRAGLDYLDKAALVRHANWEAFEAWRMAEGRRLILLSTRSDGTHTGFRFEPGDVLLAGRETSGVPDPVRDAADFSIRIPMAPGTRSLNVAVAAAMVLGEALRQTGGFG